MRKSPLNMEFLKKSSPPEFGVVIPFRDSKFSKFYVEPHNQNIGVQHAAYCKMRGCLTLSRQDADGVDGDHYGWLAIVVLAIVVSHHSSFLDLFY